MILKLRENFLFHEAIEVSREELHEEKSLLEDSFRERERESEDERDFRKREEKGERGWTP